MQLRNLKSVLTSSDPDYILGITKNGFLIPINPPMQEEKKMDLSGVEEYLNQYQTDKTQEMIKLSFYVELEDSYPGDTMAYLESHFDGALSKLKHVKRSSRPFNIKVVEDASDVSEDMFELYDEHGGI